jgi:hypothetical protein
MTYLLDLYSLKETIFSWLFISFHLSFFLSVSYIYLLPSLLPYSFTFLFIFRQIFTRLHLPTFLSFTLKEIKQIALETCILLECFEMCANTENVFENFAF